MREDFVAEKVGKVLRLRFVSASPTTVFQNTVVERIYHM